MGDLLDFCMPSLGADMTVGTVIEWRVAPGDVLQRGDIVALVDTEKAEIEVETFDAGVVESLVVPPGETVPVGAVIAQLRQGTAVPAAAVPAAAVPTAPVSTPPVLAAPAAPEVSPSLAPPPPSSPPPALAPPPAPSAPDRAARPKVYSPLVRRLARQHQVELAGVRGTGPGGRICRADVEAAYHRPKVSPRARRLAAELGFDAGRLVGLGTGPDGSVVGADVLGAAGSVLGAAGSVLGAAGSVAGESPVPETTSPVLPATAAATVSRDERMRRAIATLMERSWREIPHYHVGTRIDLSAALDWMAARNAARPVTERLLPAALLLAGTARAAVQVPEVNGWWAEGSFRPAAGVDLGVAVSLRRGGLVVPTIVGAQELDVDTLMARLRDLVGRARRGRLRSSDLAPASLTVTDLGDLGVETLQGIIHPPQVALVGFGAVRDQPWAEGGMLGVRPVLHATLAGDHRATDGRTGAAFLSAIARALGGPTCLMNTTT